MKTLLRLLPLLALTLVALRAADDKATAALRAADDERMAATKSGESARLDAIFSDDLHYAHASGTVESKASYIKSLVSRSIIYESFDYMERKFTIAAPGIALMTGRVLIHARIGETKEEIDLNFLAVWRLEGGKWRFLAWQSCKNLPPAAKKS